MKPFIIAAAIVAVLGGAGWTLMSAHNARQRCADLDTAIVLENLDRMTYKLDAMSGHRPVDEMDIYRNRRDLFAAVDEYDANCKDN